MVNTNAQKQAEAWQINVRAKIEEVRAAFANFYSALVTHRKTDAQYAQNVELLKAKVQGLLGLFADNARPHLLSELHQAIESLILSPHRSSFARDSFRTIEGIDRILTEDETESFDKIFESYKKDDRLHALVSSLITLLENILDEGDEVLNSGIAKNLSAIIDRLKKRQGFSLNELLLWLDSAGALLLRIVASVTGLSQMAELADIVSEAKKTFDAAKERVFECHDDARKETLKKANLEGVYKQLSGTPSLSIQKLNAVPPPSIDVKA